MTLDTFSCGLLLLAFGVLVAILEWATRPLPETNETDRSVFDHAEYADLLAHWNGRADELEKQWDFERRQRETIAHCREHLFTFLEPTP